MVALPKDIIGRKKPAPQMRVFVFTHQLASHSNAIVRPETAWKWWSIECIRQIQVNTSDTSCNSYLSAGIIEDHLLLVLPHLVHEKAIMSSLRNTFLRHSLRSCTPPSNSVQFLHRPFCHYLCYFILVVMSRFVRFCALHTTHYVPVTRWVCKGHSPPC